jgi:hypothetical protein
LASNSASRGSCVTACVTACTKSRSGRGLAIGFKGGPVACRRQGAAWRIVAPAGVARLVP